LDASGRRAEKSADRELVKDYISQPESTQTIRSKTFVTFSEEDNIGALALRHISSAD
jgi:hypothetical protein